MSTFTPLSDLVADSDDLLARLDNSTSPEIRAHKQRIASSLRDMKHRFKHRVRASRRAKRDWDGSMNLWVPAAAAAILAFGLLTMMVGGVGRSKRLPK
jgi:hypothetical protein